MGADERQRGWGGGRYSNEMMRPEWGSGHGGEGLRELQDVAGAGLSDHLAVGSLGIRRAMSAVGTLA